MTSKLEVRNVYGRGMALFRDGVRIDNEGYFNEADASVLSNAHDLLELLQDIVGDWPEVSSGTIAKAKSIVALATKS